MTMNRKKFVSLDKVGQGLAKIEGMPELIEEETASLHAAHFVEQARKQAKLSQADLAEKIGVSQARVSQMEKGEGPYGLSISLLERVAAACGGVLQIKFKKAQHAGASKQAATAG
jgi:DNA-binding XRE family transcriptional regulator